MTPALSRGQQNYRCLRSLLLHAGSDTPKTVLILLQKAKVGMLSSAGDDKCSRQEKGQVANDLKIRPVTRDDAHELATLLNEIIARGGTTALEEPFEPGDLAESFLIGPDVICCFVAADHSTGKLIGFQTLGRNSALPQDVGDIGTFALVGGTQRGVGSALFEVVRTEARKRGLTAINATIRADNSGGLAFYHRMGFVDHAVARGVPLKDGTPVDRISKRYSLS